MISTPCQGQNKELQLEAILIEATLVLPKAISYLLNADSQKSPSTGHSTALFPISLLKRGLRV